MITVGLRSTCVRAKCLTCKVEIHRHQRWESLFPEERPQRSKVGTSDNSLLLDSPWLKCNWLDDPPITASGLRRGTHSFDNSTKQQLVSASRSASPSQSLGSVRRQSTRFSVTGNSTAPREVETPEIHGPRRKERSIDQDFSRPERLQSYVTRAGAVFVDAMLGRLWEEVRPLLRGVVRTFLCWTGRDGSCGSRRKLRRAFVGAPNK